MSYRLVLVFCVPRLWFQLACVFSVCFCRVVLSSYLSAMLFAILPWLGLECVHGKQHRHTGTRAHTHLLTCEKYHRCAVCACVMPYTCVGLPPLLYIHWHCCYCHCCCCCCTFYQKCVAMQIIFFVSFRLYTYWNRYMYSELYSRTFSQNFLSFCLSLSHSLALSAAFWSCSVHTVHTLIYSHAPFSSQHILLRLCFAVLSHCRRIFRHVFHPLFPALRLSLFLRSTHFNFTFHSIWFATK